MLSVDTLCWFFLVAVCCCGEANDFLLQGCSLSYSNRKKMVDTSPADVVFLEPSDDLREDPFVLPDVLGYLGMPDPVCWAVPTDLNRLLGIIKLARTLSVNAIIEHLSSVLEISPETVKSSKTGALRKKIRDHLRCVYLLCSKMMGMCYLLLQCLK